MLPWPSCSAFRSHPRSIRRFHAPHRASRRVRGPRRGRGGCAGRRRGGRAAAAPDIHQLARLPGRSGPFIGQRRSARHLPGRSRDHDQGVDLAAGQGNDVWPALGPAGQPDRRQRADLHRRRHRCLLCPRRGNRPRHLAPFPRLRADAQLRLARNRRYRDRGARSGHWRADRLRRRRRRLPVRASRCDGAGRMAFRDRHSIHDGQRLLRLVIANGRQQADLRGRVIELRCPAGGRRPQGI